MVYVACFAILAMFVSVYGCIKQSPAMTRAGQGMGVIALVLALLLECRQL